MSDKNIYESVRDDTLKVGKGAIWIAIVGGLLILFYMSFIFAVCVLLLLLTGVFALTYYLWSKNTLQKRCQNNISFLQEKVLELDKLIENFSNENSDQSDIEISIKNNDLSRLYTEKSKIQEEINENAKKLANYLADQLVSSNKTRDTLINLLSSSDSENLKKQIEENKTKIICFEKELSDIKENFGIEPDELGAPSRGTGKYPLLKHCSEFAAEIFKKM